jgi:hypothetical protein
MYTTIPQTAVVSIALIVGGANIVIIPAQGPLFAIRVVGCQLSVDRTSAGITDLDLHDNNLPGLGGQIVRGSIGVGGTRCIIPFIPEPGIQISVNTSLVLETTSTSNTGNGIALVYYFIDQVGP